MHTICVNLKRSLVFGFYFVVLFAFSQLRLPDLLFYFVICQIVFLSLVLFRDWPLWFALQGHHSVRQLSFVFYLRKHRGKKKKKSVLTLLWEWFCANDCTMALAENTGIYARFVRELGSGWSVTSASGIHQHPLVHQPATCLVGGLKELLWFVVLTQAPRRSGETNPCVSDAYFLHRSLHLSPAWLSFGLLSFTTIKTSFFFFLLVSVETAVQVLESLLARWGEILLNSSIKNAYILINLAPFLLIWKCNTFSIRVEKSKP